MLMLLGVAAIGELAVVFLFSGWPRKVGSALVLLLLAFACGGIVAARPGIASVLVLIVGAYRAVNLLRIVEARMNEAYLRRATRTTSVWLIGLQALVLSAWLGMSHYKIAGHVWLASLVGLQLLASAVLLAATLRNLRKTKLTMDMTNMSDKELPSITIAVPARNEDEQLEACLQSILASDYPKFEVLVLDDCSQDRTSEIIRKFAHDGVRFIAGSEPKPSWLAKNQAYARLAEEASGDMILFCGVDVRFDPQSIRRLITAMIQKEKSMLSAMPLNTRSGASLPQSMRFMWELALPRRQFNRPPVLSSCWLIKTSALKHYGGFAAVAHSIIPEAHLAREAIKQDGYSFVRSDEHLTLTSVKSSREQRETATRTRYPQVHRRPEFVAILGIIEAAFLLVPFAMVLAALAGIIGVSWLIVEFIVVVLLLIMYGRLTFAMFPNDRWAVVPVFPVAVLVDIALLNYSMWKYEFSEVIWKGRNVCLPVMHADRH